jgi:hypothetical protein
MVNWLLIARHSRDAQDYLRAVEGVYAECVSRRVLQGRLSELDLHADGLLVIGGLHAAELIDGGDAPQEWPRLAPPARSVYVCRPEPQARRP